MKSCEKGENKNKRPIEIEGITFCWLDNENEEEISTLGRQESLRMIAENGEKLANESFTKC